MIRRVGALGDIHAEDELLERALWEMAEERLDLIVAVGDLVDGPGDVDRCCELLRQHDVQAVRGNHERWMLEGKLRSLPHATHTEQLAPGTQDFLRDLPRTRTFATVAGTLLVCHGLGEDDMGQVKSWHGPHEVADNDALQGLLRQDRFELVINGHSHDPLDRRFGRLRLLNAGTLCRDHGPGYLLVDLESGEATHRSL